MKTVVKVALPQTLGRISGNASIHSLPSGGYYAVIAVTRHPEEAPIRTDIVREFNSRHLLIAYLKTRKILRRSVKTATPASTSEKEKNR